MNRVMNRHLHSVREGGFVAQAPGCHATSRADVSYKCCFASCLQRHAAADVISPVRQAWHHKAPTW